MIKFGLPKKESTKRAGFTMVEVVVMLSIITILSIIVLFNFTGLNEGGALARSTRELALALRQAQNMALAVNQVQAGVSPSPLVNKIPPAVGIKLIRGTSNYQIFADFNPRNDIYSGSSESIGNALVFERKISISSLFYYDAFGRKPISAVNIIFTAPEAAISIRDVNGEDKGDKLEIELTAPTTGSCKKLVIITSGQISIKSCQN